MVLAAFLLQVPGLALVRSTRARPSVPTFGPRGLCVMVGSGDKLRFWFETLYGWYLKK